MLPSAILLFSELVYALDIRRLGMLVHLLSDDEKPSSGNLNDMTFLSFVRSNLGAILSLNCYAFRCMDQSLQAEVARFRNENVGCLCVIKTTQ